jgi:hypothetical protein
VLSRSRPSKGREREVERGLEPGGDAFGFCRREADEVEGRRIGDTNRKEREDEHGILDTKFNVNYMTVIEYDYQNTLILLSYF